MQKHINVPTYTFAYQNIRNVLQLMKSLKQYDEEKSQLFLVCIQVHFPGLLINNKVSTSCVTFAAFISNVLCLPLALRPVRDVHQNEHARDLTLIELKKFYHITWSLKSDLHNGAFIGSTID
uniref:Uncharacterized protein n=1 Tax=Glossina austeni TaxID=7395 RepID=A0A1A9VF80_GLOAU